MTRNSLFRLWAKTNPFHPLLCHLLDVGHVALELLSTSTFHGTIRRLHQATGIPEPAVPGWIAYLVALHDLGKCRPEFQAKGPPELVDQLKEIGLPCLKTEGFRHEAATADWVSNHLRFLGGWNPESAFTVSNALGIHHGILKAEAPREHPGLTVRWEPMRQELHNLVREAFQPEPWARGFSDHSVAGILLSGLTVFSDCIASNPDLFELNWTDDSMTEYIPVSRQRAARAVRKLGLAPQSPWLEKREFREVWPELTNLRPLQEACEDLAPDLAQAGLIIVEAAMGEGKTEAALYLATQLHKTGLTTGICVSEPTGATTNQMFGRVNSFITSASGEQRVRLIHSTSWLIDEETPERPPQVWDDGDANEIGERVLNWFRPSKRGLLDLNTVNTVDQVMLSVMNVKHGFLRLLGLSTKVLIIDEVHAYDRYMIHILTCLLAWCRVLRTPVILLSATLPRRRRADLIRAFHPSAQLADSGPPQADPYPLITLVDQAGRVKEVRVPVGPAKKSIAVQLHNGLLENHKAIARLVATRAQDGGCLCVIANTVASAQTVYDELKRILPETSVRTPVQTHLFHARFPVSDRMTVEQRCLSLFGRHSTLDPTHPGQVERPAWAILVATQVVEQSLDLDFDEMFTELAPIDLLLQRSGRLHRHDRGERPTGTEPTLHIFLPTGGSEEFGPTGSVYEPYLLMRTVAELSKHEVWQIPKAIRSLVEEVYGPHPPDGAGPFSAEILDAALSNMERTLKREDGEAKRYVIPQPDPAMFTLPYSEYKPFEEEEDEEGGTTFFTAKTRIGDETQKLLLVDGEPWEQLLDVRQSPARDVLKAIHLRTVNIPNWWLKGVTPQAPHVNPTDGPPWLPGTKVLRLRSGVWEGCTSRGKQVTIRVDKEYGVVREEGEMGDQFQPAL